MKKTVAFISHSKSFSRLKPEISAVKDLGFGIALLTNDITKKPNFVADEEIFQVDLGNEDDMLTLLQQFNIIWISTSTDHLFLTAVKLSQKLGIESACDIATAEIFVNKFKHIQHAQSYGMKEHVPTCIEVNCNFDYDLLTEKNTPIFIKPAIGCGMRGLFNSPGYEDDYLFEYKGITDGKQLKTILVNNNLEDKFIEYCVKGSDSFYYYPVKPKALIQDFYHTNKSYTFQYSVLNGIWYYNSIGQVFYNVQPSERTSGERTDPLQDPRTRLTDGSRLHSEEVGYYHLPEVPEHIFPFFIKCVKYMKDNFKIRNMGLTLAIHETIDGKFYMTDLNPRVGGQWSTNYQFSQPDFYLKYWSAILNKSVPINFDHCGPLGCVNPLFLDPGVIDSCIIPNDSEKLIITGRNKLVQGIRIPEFQSMNSNQWPVRIYTCGKNLDDQVSAVLKTTKNIRNNIRYR